MTSGTRPPRAFRRVAILLMLTLNFVTPQIIYTFTKVNYSIVKTHILIASLININIPPLHPTDTVAKALSWMDQFKVSHLPLVDQSGKLIGNISEAELIDSNVAEKTIGSLKLVLDRSYISNHQHYLDVLKIFSKSNLTVIPVMDKSKCLRERFPAFPLFSP